MMPIHQGVVEAHTQTLGSRSFNILANHISPGSLLRSTVAGQLRIEIAEALMMLGSHHHVFHASLFGQVRPRARRIQRRPKSNCVRYIFIYRDGLVLHDPFMPLYCAVDAEVNEHAELCSMPPLHSLC